MSKPKEEPLEFRTIPITPAGPSIGGVIASFFGVVAIMAIGAANPDPSYKSPREIQREAVVQRQNSQAERQQRYHADWQASGKSWCEFASSVGFDCGNVHQMTQYPGY